MERLLSSRVSVRPVQASRHCFKSAVARSPDTYFSLYLFKAAASESRPGRKPARVSSFTRRNVWLDCARAQAAGSTSPTMALVHSENFIQPRFKVLFPFRPQHGSLDRQRLLDRPDPVHQLLNVLARLLVILAQH